MNEAHLHEQQAIRSPIYNQLYKLTMSDYGK